MKSKKILVFVDWFLPGYKAGGPITSVANMASVFRKVYEIKVVTSAFDYNEPEPYNDVLKDQWTSCKGHTVFYFSKRNPGVIDLYRLLKDDDSEFIYLNSMFSWSFSILPLFLLRTFFRSRTVVLAPRGMLAPGALSIKANKKSFFLKLIALSGIHRSIRWHATNQEERRQIETLFKGAKVTIAPNLVKPPSLLKTEKRKEPGSLKLICIARISPEKNLLFALEILRDLDIDFELAIYGSINDREYWSACNDVISQMRKGKVFFNGPVAPNEIEDAFSNAHFLFLPTLGENFGHVIYESLSQGVPVIISDQTPWKDLKARKAGWEIPLNEKKRFKAVITDCYTMGTDEYLCLSQGALKVAVDFANDPVITEQSSKLFS